MNCDGFGGCGDARGIVIVLLVFVVILALIGLIMVSYILIIIGQRLFQRHVEILSRREACGQQEVVDLSEINHADIPVVEVEATAPLEPETEV